MRVNGKPYGIITLADDYHYQTVDVGHIPHTALSKLPFEGTGVY